jgi:hypothetical protein
MVYAGDNASSKTGAFEKRPRLQQSGALFSGR